MQSNFRKKLLVTSISSCLLASATIQAQETQETEEVVVTGIRGSLMNALNTKRESTAFVDSISAEDVGKFPDKNVAESLQRVPGVSIQRQFGEGASVSIRGAGNELTKTTLNGQNVASTGWFVLEPAKRSFNYELLPSELVGSVDVYKTPHADLQEGGVGGSVVVKTRKPLDMDPLTLQGTIEGSYQSDSGEMDPQLSAMASWKDDSDTFGFLVAGIMQERSLQRRGNEAFWQWGAGPVAFTQQRERTGLAAAFQFAPGDNLDMTLNVIDLQMEADNVNYALWLTQLDTTWGGGTTETWLDGTPVAGPLNVAFAQTRPRKATMNSSVVDFEIKYSTDSWAVSAQAGVTESDGGTSFEAVFEDGTGGTSIVDPASRYDFTSGHQTWDLPQGFTLRDYNPGTLAMGGNPNFNQTPKTDEETYFQVDAEYFMDGPITKIKLGARSADHEATSLRYDMGIRAGADLTFNTTPDVIDGYLNIGTGDYQMLHFDEDAMFAFADSVWDGTREEDLGAHSEISETNTAFYIMAEYETGAFSGDFGVRAIDTEATSTYYVPVGTAMELRETTESYSEVLPNLNVKYSLTDDVLIRSSIARTIARPQYVDMYVNAFPTGTEDGVPNNQFWIQGNVGLKPYAADQMDLGVEWYFADGGLLSAAFFMKDVENFVVVQQTDNVPASDVPFTLVDAAEAADGWTVQSKENGRTAEIRGFEFQYQQDYGNGFGSLFNYTYTDAAADKAPAGEDPTFTDGNLVMTDSSQHMTNMSVYFENDTVNTRLSYNWRSEYMIRESGSYGNRLHDDFGTLDFSGSLFLTDNLEVRLNINNLLEEGSVQKGNNNFATPYSGFERGFPTFEYQMSRNIAVGLSFKL